MFYDDSKKGAHKLGVKLLPKITHVEVNRYVLPLTHMGLAINNDTIAAYKNRVERISSRFRQTIKSSGRDWKSWKERLLRNERLLKVLMTARTD